MTAAYTFQNAVTGKTVTAELFELTDPNLTFNGKNQIEAIRKAVSVKAEFVGKIGKITVTVKQANAVVTDATNAGSYDVWVTCEAGSEYDALTTPMKIGSVILRSEAAGGSSSSVVPPDRCQASMGRSSSSSRPADQAAAAMWPCWWDTA